MCWWKRARWEGGWKFADLQQHINQLTCGCRGGFCSSTLPTPVLQGQFVFLKYAFAELSSRDGWTVQQMAVQLPTGLAGAFQLALGTLQQAMQREKPVLLATMRERMLPLLVAAREPLTAGQLAWMAGIAEAEVEELLHYLAGLFRWKFFSAA